MVDFKLGFLQESVFEGTKEFLVSEGFSFLKSQKIYKKKMHNNVIEVAFDFINYAPNSYQFNFVCIVWIKEIIDITKKMYNFHGLKIGVMSSASFFEGEFIENLNEKEEKFRVSFHNEAYNLTDVPVLINNMLQRIKHGALPMAYSVCDLYKYQSYYLTNRDPLIRNIAKSQFITAVLMAAYLKDDQTYKEISTFLRKILDEKKVNDSDYKNIYSIIDMSDEFVSHHYSM